MVESERGGSGSLRVELLGPVRAWLGDGEINLGSARKRSVFAALAVRANQVVSHEELIDGLWGEAPPASVDGMIYTYVSELRRVLEPTRPKRSVSEILMSVGSGYQLRLELDRLDIHRFDHLRELAQTEWNGGRQGLAISLLDEALGLWHGEPLSGISGPLVERHRVRFSELRLAALERRAEFLISTGAAAETIAELSGLVSQNPMREGLRLLLMQALQESGRRAEALEVFRETRALLIAELGIEPSEPLRALHEQILRNVPSGNQPIKLGPAVRERTTRPGRSAVTATDWQLADPAKFVGRSGELDTIRAHVDSLLKGRGGALWVQGEPGIGKSSLVAAALQSVSERGGHVVWGSCDNISQRSPLGVLQACLGVTADSLDTARTNIVKALREDTPRPGVWYSTDPVMAAFDRIVALVDVLCADAPLVLVVDDIQWADEFSILAWRRLARVTRQSPLLLIAVSRPVPLREDVDSLRETIEAEGGTVLSLGALPEAAVRELLALSLGASPGPRLRRLVSRATGNPLYFLQVVDSLIRERSVHTRDRVADIDDSTLREIPATIASAISRKLNFVDTGTREMLSLAAVLGADFAMGEVSAFTGKTASELMPAVVQALAAGVLADAGHRFVFRHPLLRHALYESLPAALRRALHRQAAEALATSGAPVERVVEQLLASPVDLDTWVLEWLLRNIDVIAKESPSAAVDLLEMVVGSEDVQQGVREAMCAKLARLLFWMGRDPRSEAHQLLAITRDPAITAEMRWLLAYVDHQLGEAAAASSALVSCVDDPAVPPVWRARHEALLALVQRAGRGELNNAEATAVNALRRAGETNDVFAIAYALDVLWQVASVRRDHRAALDYVDRSLDVVTRSAAFADLHLGLLDNKISTLHSLDLLDEASRTLDDARHMAVHDLPYGGMHVTAAVHHYWLGRWDDALAELTAASEDGLESTSFTARERGPVLRLYGLAALIAGRRASVADMMTWLEESEQCEITTIANRESGDLLLAAKALAAEQRGDVIEALEIFSPVLEPEYAQMMLRHQWLPTIVRLALDVGDEERARRALAVCESEAALEVTRARAWCAASWCRGLVLAEPGPLLDTAAHFRRAGRQVELAMVLEDLAVLFAMQDQIAEADKPFREAHLTYTQLQATWDISRLESRLGKYGIQHTVQPDEKRGDAAGLLSATELTIARLVARGWSNPDIAAQLPASRQAVQAHVSRIMEKLRVDSRSGIARWYMSRPS